MKNGNNGDNCSSFVWTFTPKGSNKRGAIKSR